MNDSKAKSQTIGIDGPGYSGAKPGSSTISSQRILSTNDTIIEIDGDRNDTVIDLEPATTTTTTMSTRPPPPKAAKSGKKHKVVHKSQRKRGGRRGGQQQLLEQVSVEAAEQAGARDVARGLIEELAEVTAERDAFERQAQQLHDEVHRRRIVNDALVDRLIQDYSVQWKSEPWFVSGWVVPVISLIFGVFLAFLNIHPTTYEYMAGASPMLFFNSLAMYICYAIFLFTTLLRFSVISVHSYRAIGASVQHLQFAPEDLRPDDLLKGDVKHRPRYTDMEYQKSESLRVHIPGITGPYGMACWFPKRNSPVRFQVPIEILAQLNSPAILQLGMDDALAFERIKVRMTNLISVSQNRYDLLWNAHSIQFSTALAYGIHKQMQQKVGQLPFPNAPVVTL